METEMPGVIEPALKTIEEVYKTGKLLLAGRADAELEARLLLCKSASLTEERFYAEAGMTIAPDRERKFFRLIARRISGVPLSHLTLIKEFWSLPFQVGPGVLIPRPESELIVEKVLELSARRKVLIADIGTGCGNLAVSLAHELPEARVVATDISQKALKIAQRNAATLKAAHIVFVHGSLFSPLDDLRLRKKCDFIISNPPYVSREDWKALPSEIRDHEPKEALLAGETGLEFIESLIAGAPNYLKPGGCLVFEIGWGQEERVIPMFGGEWNNIKSYRDLSGIPRVVTAGIAPK
jgi:release factor glutamine methyltransferase